MFHNPESLECSVTGDIPSSGVSRSGMLLKSSSSELSLGGGYIPGTLAGIHGLQDVLFHGQGVR